MTEQQPPTPAPEEPGPEQALQSEPAQQPAGAPAPPGAEHGTYAYPPGAPVTGAYPPGPLPGGQYGDPAFLAPPRPRVRWVNPDRRVHIAGAGLLVALVFGGAGVAIGWAASDHHDRGPIGVRLAPGHDGRYLPGPGRMGPNRQPRPAAPIPTPTSTH
jgi:hypothetical protein